jgi:hypothetical protein
LATLQLVRADSGSSCSPVLFGSAAIAFGALVALTSFSVFRRRRGNIGRFSAIGPAISFAAAIYFGVQARSSDLGATSEFEVVAGLLFLSLAIVATGAALRSGWASRKSESA